MSTQHIITIWRYYKILKCKTQETLLWSLLERCLTQNLPCSFSHERNRRDKKKITLGCTWWRWTVWHDMLGNNYERNAYGWIVPKQQEHIFVHFAGRVNWMTLPKFHVLYSMEIFFKSFEDNKIARILILLFHSRHRTYLCLNLSIVTFHSFSLCPNSRDRDFRLAEAIAWLQTSENIEWYAHNNDKHSESLREFFKWLSARPKSLLPHFSSVCIFAVASKYSRVTKDPTQIEFIMIYKNATTNE